MAALTGKVAMVADHCGSQTVTAGERAPDAIAARLSDKATVQLFELFRCTHWTLLLLSGKQAKDATGSALTALADQIGDRYTSIKTHIVTDVVPNGNWQGSVFIGRQHYLHEQYGASAACLLIA